MQRALEIYLVARTEEDFFEQMVGSKFSVRWTDNAGSSFWVVGRGKTCFGAEGFDTYGEEIIDCKSNGEAGFETNLKNSFLGSKWLKCDWKGEEGCALNVPKKGFLVVQRFESASY